MKNRSLSLMLVLSITVSGITPALNAMQTVKRGVAGAMPTWTKGPGFTAAKKWWQSGRNMNALTPQEKQAFNQLRNRVTIGTIAAVLATLLGAAALYYKKSKNVKQMINLGNQYLQLVKELKKAGKTTPLLEQKETKIINNFKIVLEAATEKEMEELSKFVNTREPQTQLDHAVAYLMIRIFDPILANKYQDDNPKFFFNPYSSR